MVRVSEYSSVSVDVVSCFDLTSFYSVAEETHL